MRSYRSKKSGFTLVEILIVVIILGILAAIVIPQFTNASTDARKSNMTSELQTLRSQVQLYKLQHADIVPPLITNWDPFTKCTKADGTIKAANPTVPDPAGTVNGYLFGPYLPSAAVNPMTSSSTVVAIGTAAATTNGWFYDATTGEIHGANVTGAQSDDGN